MLIFNRVSDRKVEAIAVGGEIKRVDLVIDLRGKWVLFEMNNLFFLTQDDVAQILAKLKELNLSTGV